MWATYFLKFNNVELSIAVLLPVIYEDVFRLVKTLK